MLDQKLIHDLLQEIDSQLKQGILPVNDHHLTHLGEGQEENVLAYLMHMKNEGLISGNIVKKGTEGTPHKMVNIRLTYQGMRALHS
jgi:hypothetical protein